ncbi:hypothetical protein PCL_12358 [Purpureocillium lilacinum]|uniref:Uncharacterized protein n=1 Tax=Purpureocillium lilacinum TaxID=33203 RepID=A0A2U3E915_PURLI|nr:hypothetical protein Purlil1_7212 [Purpureocillium lilacinum]PWI70990.1 hypothetical protein PCL_12358 [Purpureocillium lilacinum]
MHDVTSFNVDLRVSHMDEVSVCRPSRPAPLSAADPTVKDSTVVLGSALDRVVPDEKPRDERRTPLASYSTALDDSSANKVRRADRAPSCQGGFIRPTLAKR